MCEGGNAKTWKTLSSLTRIITHHNINETGEILFPPSSEHLFIKSLVRQVFVVCAVLSVKFFYSGVSVITSFASWCWRDILSFMYVLEIGMAEGAGSHVVICPWWLVKSIWFIAIKLAFVIEISRSGVLIMTLLIMKYWKV